MAQRMTNPMAIAIHRCHVREMAHSTPLLTLEPCGSHSFFSSDSPQPALLTGKHNAAMRQAATGVAS